jgi:hypothetical protein
MLLALLAAAAPAAAEAPAPTAPNTVAPVTVTKAQPVIATVKMAGDDSAIGQWVSVWPTRAWEGGRGGKAVLSCKIDVHGLAEWCKVASETPAGKGFGAAALQLRPMFKLPPATGPEGPHDAVMDIAIDFKPPDFEYGFDSNKPKALGGMTGDEVQIDAFNFRHNRIEMTPVTMLTSPVWVRAPSFDDLARAYPSEAGGVEGYAVTHCKVERSGVLTRCAAVKEEPTGKGFATAAKALAAKFRVEPTLAAQPHKDPLWVDIPMRITPPSKDERTVMAPTWLTGFVVSPKVFPPEAVAQGLSSGRGVARCTVTREGTLVDCAAEPGEPDGLGFSQAAVKLASTLKMNLWSADAQPVEGGVVHIAIRLNLAAAN